MSIHAKQTGEAVIKAEEDGDTPKVVRTFTGGRLQPSMRQVAQDGAVGIKLSNSTATSSWSLEELNVDVKQSGRSK